MKIPSKLGILGVFLIAMSISLAIIVTVIPGVKDELSFIELVLSCFSLATGIGGIVSIVTAISIYLDLV